MLMPHGPPKSRRCRFFDIQGKRIPNHGENGCPRSAATCHFIHPSDPEWTNLAPDPAHADSWRSAAESPPRRPSPSSSSSWYEHERRSSFSIDRQRGASESSPIDRRRRSPPRGSSSSAHHHAHGRSPPRRYSSSNITRDGPLLPRQPSHEHSDRPRPDPASKGVFKTPMRPSDRPSEKDKQAPPPSSYKSTTAPISTSSAAAASTASKSSAQTPMTTHSGSTKAPSRVPPPPPTKAPPTDEMTPDQRRAVWGKRIALMADATQEYMDLGKLEKDVESRRRQVQSAAFNTLPSDVRGAFEASLKTAEANYEKKKVLLDGAISKLSETDFWPAVPSQKVGDMETKLKEAKTMLGNLADSVSQLYKRIESLYGQRTGPPGSNPEGTDEGATAAGGGDGDARSKKRRRVSSSADGGDHGDDATPPEVREDVESIKDTIREIEDRLQEVENDMTQRSLDIIERLEAKMDEKIEEIARSADIAALVDAQLAPQTARTIQAFDESFAQADREILELAEEMAGLLPRLDELQRGNDLFKQEEAADKELLAQLVKADQDNAEAIARLQEEAKTLRVALTAQTKRAVPPSPTSAIPASFMEAVKGSVALQVQEQVLPIVTQIRSEMERVAKTRDAELYEKLRDKLEQSSKMSQVLSSWIERNPDDAHQALAVALARAQVDGAGGSDFVLT